MSAVTDLLTEPGDWTLPLTTDMILFAIDLQVQQIGKLAVTTTSLVFEAFASDGTPVSLIGPRPDLATAEIESASDSARAEAASVFEVNSLRTVYMKERIVS